jgi:DNA-binding MarR family transcriptional regulator
LSYGLRATPRRPLVVDPAEPCGDLPALLARVLYAFALDFESRSEMSLALAGNVLRVFGDDGVRQSDLPRLSGVSKEAIAMAIGFLRKRGLVDVADEPGLRGKRTRLSSAGVRARDESAATIRAVERAWCEGAGAERVARLRAALCDVLERRDTGGSLLARGLQPASGGWRARPPYAARTAFMQRDPNAALPHFPMILHRGGWPDGS